MTRSVLSAPLTNKAQVFLGESDHSRWTHRLLWRLYGLEPGAVLNAGPLSSPPTSGASLAADLHRLAKAMQGAAHDPATGRLDYAGLASSTLYRDYRRCAAALTDFDPMVLATVNDRLAFWINLYNALIVDAVITLGVKQSVQEVKGFFWRAAYTIGGQRYSAHDIEHGILRANAPHPAIPGPHFARGDPRRRHSLVRLDPRVHFALVCGARSCPPIAAYDPAHLDAQLDLAARAFVSGGGIRVDPGRKLIGLSRIFQWYASDFGAAHLALGRRQPLLDFIALHLDGAVSRALVTTSGWPVHFLPYDWRLNA